MTEQQKEFLRALIDCGVSMNTLIAVGSLITTDPLMREMSRRILEAENAGKKVTDGMVGQILTDMMAEATNKE